MHYVIREFVLMGKRRGGVGKGNGERGGGERRGGKGKWGEGGGERRRGGRRLCNKRLICNVGGALTSKTRETQFWGSSTA